MERYEVDEKIYSLLIVQVDYAFYYRWDNKSLALFWNRDGWVLLEIEIHYPNYKQSKYYYMLIEDLKLLENDFKPESLKLSLTNLVELSTIGEVKNGKYYANLQ